MQQLRHMVTRMVNLVLNGLEVMREPSLRFTLPVAPETER